MPSHLKKVILISLAIAYVFQFGFMSCLIEFSQQLIQLERQGELKTCSSNYGYKRSLTRDTFTKMILSSTELMHEGRLYDYRIEKIDDNCVTIQMKEDHEEQFLVQLAEKINKHSSEKYRSITTQFIYLVQQVPLKDDFQFSNYAITLQTSPLLLDQHLTNPFLTAEVKPPEALFVNS